MRKLVQVCDCKSQTLCQSSRLATVQVRLVISDAAHVFHGTSVELRHKDLVVLAEGVRFPEQLLVKVHTALGHTEHLLACC